MQRESKHLQKMPFGSTLQKYISTKKVGTEGAKALAGNTSWITLQFLCLNHNNIDAEGATSWINLSDLHLSKNNVGVKGDQAPAENALRINLRSLYLNENMIGTKEPKHSQKILLEAIF